MQHLNKRRKRDENVVKRKQSVWRREVDKMGSVGRRDEEIKWVEVRRKATILLRPWMIELDAL
jgi:hypothetical protein